MVELRDGRIGNYFNGVAFLSGMQRKNIPIDHAAWNRKYDVTAPNILGRLARREKNLWRLAFPYQDKRGDVGHAEHVVFFALELVSLHPEAGHTVIPAAILHDTGWALLPESIRDEFNVKKTGKFDLNKLNDPLFRRTHQVKGALLAARLMDKVGYDLVDIENVFASVLQHDTREGSLTFEDALMRDADKLWRFSLECWKIYIIPQTQMENARPLGFFYDQHKAFISQDGYFFTKEARKFAFLELENTWKHLQEEKP